MIPLDLGSTANAFLHSLFTPQGVVYWLIASSAAVGFILLKSGRVKREVTEVVPEKTGEELPTAEAFAASPKVEEEPEEEPNPVPPTANNDARVNQLLAELEYWKKRDAAGITMAPMTLSPSAPQGGSIAKVEPDVSKISDAFDTVKERMMNRFVEAIARLEFEVKLPGEEKPKAEEPPPVPHTEESE